MTHGNIWFIRKDGTLAANLYAYHTGHADKAVKDLINLPKLIAERAAGQVRMNQLGVTFGEAYSKVVPVMWQPVHIIEHILEDKGYETKAEVLVRHMPDFIEPAISSLANWFASRYADRWLFVPADEMPYPGPCVTVSEMTTADGQTLKSQFLIKYRDIEDQPKELILNWSDAIIKECKKAAKECLAAANKFKRADKKQTANTKTKKNESKKFNQQANQ